MNNNILLPSMKRYLLVFHFSVLSFSMVQDNLTKKLTEAAVEPNCQNLPNLPG
jgi:hypothetical protein